MNVLTKTVIKNSKRIGSFKTKKESVFSVISFLIVFLFLAIIMTIFSISITLQLYEIEQTYAFTNILLLLNFFILFTKSVFESLNVLYFSKDLRIFFRMPIKSIDLLHAKFLNMITSEYQMELIMLAIPMIIYGVITGAGFLFYLYMIIILLVLPIIPIMLTSLVIAIVMRCTNFIKNKNKVMYIAIILTAIIVRNINKYV